MRRFLKCALGSLWPKLKRQGEDTVRIAAAVHDEILLLVRESAAEEWAVTLKQVMEEAEAKWLGDIPALADVSIGKTWERGALMVSVYLTKRAGSVLAEGG